MIKVITGYDPSEMYLSALSMLINEGEEVSPRGKKVKEVRPVCLEFLDPRNRVTFIRGREINPFFQLAECFWILNGLSNVEWISKFNTSIAQFSDDGEFFNASYGERLRTWNKNDYRNFIFNPIDQLLDVYTKLSKDHDTRQAIAVIYNPLFDNNKYTLSGGLDIPCNVAMSFKIRNEKLYLTLFNRSNDIHWGLFGTNLAQFTTIMEVMASWLDVGIGTYTHITDSLHVYLEDYGSSITSRMLNSSYLDVSGIPVIHFDTSLELYEMDIKRYWAMYNGIIMDDEALSSVVRNGDLYPFLKDLNLLNDSYIKHTVKFMLVYRIYKLGFYEAAIKTLSEVELSQWKIACSRFLYDRLLKVDMVYEINLLVDHLDITDEVKSYIKGK